MVVGWVVFWSSQNLLLESQMLSELDLVLLVHRVWMEELDVWDLARHAALHLLPAAARVNKLSFLKWWHVPVSGTVHDVHLYTSLLLACYSSFSFTVISLFIVYLVSLIKSFCEFQPGILLPHSQLLRCWSNSSEWEQNSWHLKYCPADWVKYRCVCVIAKGWKDPSEGWIIL